MMFWLAHRGTDSIYADEGNDQISGSFGADYLAGGDGDDVLEGGPDADFLDGGTRVNTLVFAPGFGVDFFQAAFDYGEGDVGDNILHFAAGIGPDDLTFTWAQSGTYYNALIISVGPSDSVRSRFYATYDPVTGDITLDDVPPFSAITFGDGSPSLTFADILPLIQVVEANEVFGADTGAGEVLTGTEGMDSIFAETGTNVIDALGGDDEVYGGAGFDTITGGAGSDFLTDEGGGVEFRFAPGLGRTRLSAIAHRRKLQPWCSRQELTLRM